MAMVKPSFVSSAIATAVLLLSFFQGSDAGATAKSTYLVHFSDFMMPQEFAGPEEWHDASLRSVSGDARIIHRYSIVIHGFAARLTSVEALALEELHGATVIVEQRYELHTTRTPHFLGLQEWPGHPFPESESLSDIIVGVLDTGVWPESKSFADENLGPVPSKWRGFCDNASDFNASTSCNRKLIGARYFCQGYEARYGKLNETIESRSPRDKDGHGTHTSTTAAGSAVPNANLFGYASGTAQGMAEAARIAAYKVCWLDGCLDSDTTAGMEAAIRDGVDVLSLSFGPWDVPVYKDMVAIGAFAAIERGIVVVCSAGNRGPDLSSLHNQAPWIITVGAGTLDRDFLSTVTLGNRRKYRGVSLYSGKRLADRFIPIVYAGNVSKNASGNLCLEGTLDPAKVSGKIVLCDVGRNYQVEKGITVKKAGGVGMIVAEKYGYEQEVAAHVMPAIVVHQESRDEIKEYISTAANPKAAIFSEGTVLGIKPSPVLASFSSRGPNSIMPEILKPDLIAPGVNILAGWPGAVGPSFLPFDQRRVEFNILSGTSMSCPHVSGLVALLKAAHPDWSPAAIRSALMTTAYSTDNNGNAIIDVATHNASTPFGFGAGHVAPRKALSPGLIYNTTMSDYRNSLCSLNYTRKQRSIISKKHFTCNSSVNYSAADLNYPSFAVVFASRPVLDGPVVRTFTRSVTNLGGPAKYDVFVFSPSPTVKIAVKPKTLSFAKKNERKKYRVSFSSSPMPSGTHLFGRLTWSDGKNDVSSPIAFSWL